MLGDIILYCAMLWYVMLCYAILCYAMLCYAMLFYVMLCFVMLCYIWCYIILCYVTLCYVILSYVMLCYVLLCYIILFYFRLCYVMLWYVMLWCAMLRYVMLYYFTLCYSYLFLITAPYTVRMANYSVKVLTVPLFICKHSRCIEIWPLLLYGWKIALIFADFLADATMLLQSGSLHSLTLCFVCTFFSIDSNGYEMTLQQHICGSPAASTSSAVICV